MHARARANPIQAGQDTVLTLLNSRKNNQCLAKGHKLKPYNIAHRNPTEILKTDSKFYTQALHDITITEEVYSLSNYFVITGTAVMMIILPQLFLQHEVFVHLLCTSLLSPTDSVPLLFELH